MIGKSEKELLCITRGCLESHEGSVCTLNVEESKISGLKGL